MISSGNQNKFPSSFAPFGDLLKAFMFLSNLNDFYSSLSLPNQRFTQQKDSSKVWKEKGLKWFSHFFSPSLFLFMHYLCLLLSCFWVNLVLCYVLFNMFLFFCFFVLLLLCVFFFFFPQFCFILFFYKNNFIFWKNRKIQKQCVFYIHWYLGWPLKQSSLNFVSFVA